MQLWRLIWPNLVMMGVVHHCLVVERLLRGVWWVDWLVWCNRSWLSLGWKKLLTKKCRSKSFWSKVKTESLRRSREWNIIWASLSLRRQLIIVWVVADRRCLATFKVWVFCSCFKQTLLGEWTWWRWKGFSAAFSSTNSYRWKSGVFFCFWKRDGTCLWK